MGAEISKIDALYTLASVLPFIDVDNVEQAQREDLGNQDFVPGYGVTDLAFFALGKGGLKPMSLQSVHDFANIGGSRERDPGIVSSLFPNPNDISVDLSADDSFTRALDEMQANVELRMATSPEISTLLEKPNWTIEDRALWEETISGFVSQEMDKIPSLDSYRHREPLKTNERTASGLDSLNDLSSDIDNGTHNLEFDCRSMSAVEGLVLQRIDDETLPAESDVQGHKYAGNYLLASGVVSFSAYEDPELGKHGFIVSSVTGNVIEATSSAENGGSSYQRILSKNPLQDIAQGRLLIASEGNVYGGLANESDVRDSINALKEGNPTQYAEMISRRYSSMINDFPNVVAGSELYEVIGLYSRGELSRQDFDGFVNDPSNAKALELLTSRYEDIKSAWSDALKAAEGDPEKLQEAQDGMNASLQSMAQRADSIPIDMLYTPDGGLEITTLRDGLLKDYPQMFDENQEQSPNLEVAPKPDAVIGNVM